MAIPQLVPKGVLGRCDPSTKTITLFHETPLEMSESELRRLASLGKKCFKIAQTFGGEETRKEMEKLGFENFGSRKNPYYGAEAHWLFGILGGLEIDCGEMYEGLSYSRVFDKDEEVFQYRDDPENPKIMTYVRGPWEDRIPELYETARRIVDKKILTLEDLNFC